MQQIVCALIDRLAFGFELKDHAVAGEESWLADPAAFERRWSDEFVPRAERMPGLRRVALARTYGGPMGPTDVYLIHEFFFDDAQALRQAMTGPEGVEAGRALMGFAARQVSLSFAEHLEEERPIPVRPA